VNATLILTFWRQRLMSPLRMVFLFCIVSFPLLVTLAAPQTGFTVAGNVTGIALVFAIGLIGQDVSSGVLQLLFARPVRRWEYVTSRWLSAGSIAALVAIAQGVLVALIMTVRGAAPGAGDTLAFVGERVLGAFGLAAVFVLLSSLVAGVGDVALWIAGQAALAISAMVAQTKGWMAAGRVLGELQAALNPGVPITQIVNGLAPWAPLSAYLSAIAVCLTLAVMLINRRELSYASSNG
jgi:ABC-type transport system involved in multi-copper enzyme maturation permease subunit